MKNNRNYKKNQRIKGNRRNRNAIGKPNPSAPKQLTQEQMALGGMGEETRGCNCRWSPWWGNWYCSGSNCQNPGATCWNNHAVCSERPPDPKERHPKQGPL